MKSQKYHQIRELIFENKDYFLKNTKEETLKFCDEYKNKLDPNLYELILDVINEIYI